MTPYLTCRADLADAAELMRHFGRGAGGEAGLRAGHSRQIGNHLHFCRWRQIGRLIALLEETGPVGTVH